MDTQPAGIQTIDEYIAKFPPEIQVILEEMRATIHAAAPDARECLSYSMAAFAQEGNLVYFAANKHHIGLYPTSSAIKAFQQELAAFEGSKGTVRFPFDKPLPRDLITRIVQFRVTENLARAAAKARKRKT